MFIVKRVPPSSVGRSDSAYALATATEGTCDELSALRTIFSPFLEPTPDSRFDFACSDMARVSEQGNSTVRTLKVEWTEGLEA
jgi:hypothetical protein